MNVERCTRCDSKIVERDYTRDDHLIEIRRFPDTQSYTVDDAKLCSMCFDDLWEWVFENDIDRSDKADPLELEKMAESVDRHIEDLQAIIEQLENYND